MSGRAQPAFQWIGPVKPASPAPPPRNSPACAALISCLTLPALSPWRTRMIFIRRSSYKNNYPHGIHELMQMYAMTFGAACRAISQARIASIPRLSRPNPPADHSYFVGARLVGRSQRHRATSYAPTGAPTGDPKDIRGQKGFQTHSRQRNSAAHSATPAPYSSQVCSMK